MKSSVESPLVTTLVRRLHLRIRKEGLEELLAAGYTDLTAAHIYVFQSPGPDGMRPTDLAARSNMTKQAMNHLLAGLERGGYLTRVPATNDGRSKVLRMTSRGRDVQRIIQRCSARLEREWAAAVGKQRVEELRAVLRDINALEHEDD
jgi:DNA-binding MarR family transcriptional regulator